MNPQPLEIYQLGPIRWRDCEDARPCVILDPPRRNRVTVALISGSDLYQGPPTHVLIEESHTDFKETGLDRTSFVAGDQIHEVKLGDLKRKRGALKGGLAAAFKRWIL